MGPHPRIWCYFGAFAAAAILLTQGRVDSKDSTSCGCLNGGTCRNDACACPPGWSGQRCESCFGRTLLTAESGLISDGPRNYSKNLRCSWLIDGTKAGAGSVSLRLSSFVTECAWDHVYIYDGDGVYSPQLAALSGVMTPLRSLGEGEIVAKSGQAFLYFYSDLAYNMSGFNISYQLDGCPLGCSGHGVCNETRCECDEDWGGPDCARKKGDQSCGSLPFCDGECVGGVCKCGQSKHGSSCSVSLGAAVWAQASVGSAEAGARASHAATVVGDALWVSAGLHFQGHKPAPLAKYSLTTGQWSAEDAVLSSAAGVNPLESLYDHSMVNYKGKLYVFGGVRDDRNISAQLWEYNPETRQWTQMSPEQSGARGPPYAAAGHTATVVGNVMLVIFGYNPYWGYLNRVQEFHFLNSSWVSPDEAVDCGIKGSYGHSAVVDVDPVSSNVYVFGGYHAGESTTGQVLDQLLIYHPLTRTWTRGRSSGFQVFRHSAALIGGAMIVVGGNAHNSTQPHTPTKCYADTVLAYDLQCDRWYSVPANVGSGWAGVARYGHSLSASAKGDALFLFGGFNGRMLGNVLRYDPGLCSFWKDRVSCLNGGNDRPYESGIRCVWLKTPGRCMDETQAANSRLLPSKPSNLDKSGETESVCPGNSLSLEMECAAAEDCGRCLSNDTVSGCGWCGGSCSGGCEGGGSCARPPACCAQLRSCFACGTRDECAWERPKHALLGRCLLRDSMEREQNTLTAKKVLMEGGLPSKKEQPTSVDGAPSLAVSVSECPAVCAERRSCGDCTSGGCMWCASLGRCVDINAYMAAFPYGQCTEWTSGGADNTCEGGSNCTAAQTCAGCQEMGPRCGWCDDGSGTGLGSCVEGGASGPVVAIGQRNFQKDPSLCPAKHWFFFHCPACQCNGHGQCGNSSALYVTPTPAEELSCEACDGDTTGPHCDTCGDGFFGNALNGGNCSHCACNGKARSCEPHTGECYCTTKGVSGDHCEKCDQRYIASPAAAGHNDTCYYELSVDFIFTFKLDSSDPKDRYVNQINFITVPQKEGTDVKFKLTCSGAAARVNLSVSSGSFDVDPRSGRRVRQFLAAAPCNEIERKFNHNEFNFGTEANTTFYVYLYDFKTPVIIQISFAQTPPIDWLRFFITFACCFVALLFVAAVLWKVKMSVDLYRRRQRMYVEMAHMASRPFSSIALDLHSPKPRPTPIAVEPTNDYQAAVVTVALRLPTGGRRFAPSGHTGLAVASALVPLCPAYEALLNSPDDKPAPGGGALSDKLPKFLRRIPRPNLEELAGMRPGFFAGAGPGFLGFMPSNRRGTEPRRPA